ncbi:hypothetical protein, partial [Sulfobacillus thermosulfidooxidans]|uniref:hypothetical protein n=1 Tax=Sulfobacillus thermosulfidooxidans TaxID=28034 RepID=UPI001A9A6A70
FLVCHDPSPHPILGELWINVPKIRRWGLFDAYFDRTERCNHDSVQPVKGILMAWERMDMLFDPV